MPTHPPKPSATKQTKLQPNQTAFLRILMDRKNHNGFDPRYPWPHLTPVPWFPVSGVNWPQQPPSSFFPAHDASLGHFFASPAAAAAFARQHTSAAMSQPHENADANLHSSPAAGRTSPTRRPPSPRVSEEADNNIDAADWASGGTGAMVTGQAQPPPVPTNRALQQLARHLDDVIKFCEKCLQQHKGDTKPYMMKGECRNQTWKNLLEDKFAENDQDRYLFANLQADVQWYVRSAQAAAAMDARAHAGDDGEKKAKYDNVYHEVDIINNRSRQVTRQAGVAMNDLAVCQQMVSEMKKMKAACEELTGDKPSSEENGAYGAYGDE